MPFVLPIVAGAYALILFRLAWRVESTPRGAHWVDQPLAYALSLAVYCTSWTYFGAVGTAATAGWTYLPIYLGPALLFLFGQDFLRRLADAVRRENLTSIADYISSRYGKSRRLSALVSVIALLASLPYIALQLKSLGMSVGAMLSTDISIPPTPSSTLIAIMAAALAFFAIIFGARRYEATGRNRGLIAAIAVEGLVKLAALTLLGLYAVYLFLNADADARAAGAAQFSALFSFESFDFNFITITLLSLGAIVCLPRQFYIGFVEYRTPRDLKVSHWAFPLYMAATALVVAPITLAGLAFLPIGAAPDLFVLDLPLAHGADGLALLAFLGGFSAATGMVVVECVALSTMISNDLVAPILLRGAQAHSSKDYGALVLRARRISIAALMALAFLFYLFISADKTLASIGLVAFAAVVQFAPALVASIYWTKGTQLGARAGLIVGAALWTYTLLLPALLGGDLLERSGLTTVLGGLLNPQALLGIELFDPLSHGVIWSLGCNGLAFVLASLGSPAAVADRLRAAVFNPGAAVGGAGGARTTGDMLALAERFVGADQARSAFATALAPLDISAGISQDVAQLTERLVAQVIGAPSARVIVGSAVKRGSLDVADVVSIIDETKQELLFSRELLAATLDNISQGVSVIDQDLRLVAWNQKYLDLFDFPPGFVQVGRPIEDVIRYNAQRGECGPGGVEAHVARRLAALRKRVPHTYERLRPNGAVLKSIGNPMPGGGYVTSFTDITAEKEAQAALQSANERLESRVEARTSQLRAANEELEAAKIAAENATLSKTKFLAAASHDLLQPLNAARLFTAALNNALKKNAPDTQRLADSIDRSIGAADSLLRALLDISKLEAGGIVAKLETFPLGPLLDELASQFAPLALAKGLKLNAAPTQLWVRTDRNLLRSALQNFLSNAVRYTAKGGVLIGARPRGARVVIEVWDTGCGVPEEKHKLIFEEFRRLHPTEEEAAAGLGLAIVERIARLTSASVALRSRPGAGSVFSIDAQRSAVGVETESAAPSAPTAPILGLRVLCVDNEPDILSGLSALLKTWGAEAICAQNFAEAETAMRADALDAALIDFNLGETMNGLDVVDKWRAHHGAKPFAVITATTSSALAREVAAQNGALMRKPIIAAELLNFLRQAKAQA